MFFFSAKNDVLIGLNFRRRHSALVEHCSRRNRPSHANPCRCNRERCGPVSDIGSRWSRHHRRLKWEKVRGEKQKQGFYHDRHDNHHHHRRHCFRRRRCSNAALDNRDSDDLIESEAFDRSSSVNRSNLVGCNCSKRFDCCPTGNRARSDHFDCSGN